MNDWSYKPFTIVEADDFQDRWDRNGLNFLFYWKTKFPDFKITLFTIPDRTSKSMVELMSRHDWIELAMHGWNHESNFECYGWNYEKTTRFIKRALEMGYKKVFKAPGWCITPDYNGYPSDDHNLIHKDKLAVYQALLDNDFIIFDRHYNAPIRPKDNRIICIDCNPHITHFHTWDMETGDEAGRNGFQQVENEKGVPWDQKTRFHMVDEAFKKSLFNECKANGKD